MTDLDAIKSIRPEIDLPTSAELASARLRLDDAISHELRAAQTESMKSHASPPAALSYRRRRIVGFALAGTLAAAAAGLAAIFAVPGSSPTRPVQGPSVVHLAVVQFLDKAAAAALQQPSSPPLPSQFVYSETEGPDGTLNETWLSVDGSISGLTEWTDGSSTPDPGAAGSNVIAASCSIAQAEATGCSASVGYYPDLPTDPNAVLALSEQDRPRRYDRQPLLRRAARLGGQRDRQDRFRADGDELFASGPTIGPLQADG